MLIDGHLDLAMNARSGRDLTLDLAALRARDRGGETAMVTLPELRAAGVRLCFGTLFAEPQGASSPRGSADAAGARRQALAQLDVYRRWEDAGELRVLRNRAEVAAHLEAGPSSLGVVLLMEGADPLADADDLPFWVAQGVRIIGPAWGATRFAGGTDAPGPLTPAGHDLVTAMRELGVTLDASHLDDAAFWDAVRIGPQMVATHANARALVPGNRQLTDEMARAVAGSGGVVGLVLFAKFIRSGWKEGDARPPLSDLVRHAEHYAALVGWDRLALGSDLDGGFGMERGPLEVDRYRHVTRFLDLLPAEHRAGVAGQNWARWLRESF